jgi:U4/U6 small nuclear ribonucleoprotein PRP3
MGLGPRHDGSSRIQKPESAAEKMAALKARVAAAIGGSKAKGGLNVGLHPALEDLSQWKPPNRTTEAKAAPARAAQPDGSHTGHAQGAQNGTGGPGAAIAPKESRDGAGRRGSNPYYDEGTSQATSSRQRHSRQLVFNQKGKYIQQANALRRQAALEAMKRRIAEQTRKAGIDDDLDVEKNFAVECPPDVEWWDEGLVHGSGYADLDKPGALKITVEDSIITEFIQHPVAIEPPQDQNIPAPKPMYLTTKEQKKIRRQRRMADLKERQAKEKLGLIPAPPPKVKKANLMRVLGEEAVKDPTAVEARVNREIAERRQQHVQANDERKLTKDQRHEKVAAGHEKDAAKGIHMLVFKIASLANGQHRFKIDKNAKQLALTGICIMHPKFNLIIVEGGEQSINRYRKLMMNRIDWTENAPSRQVDGQRDVVRNWLQAEDEEGNLKDMSSNEVKLVFEGQEKARAFKRWGTKVCETDAEAREMLARHKLENFWSLAKSFT